MRLRVFRRYAVISAAAVWAVVFSITIARTTMVGALGTRRSRTLIFHSQYMIDKSWAVTIGSIASCKTGNDRLCLFHSRDARACVEEKSWGYPRRTMVEAPSRPIAMRTIVLSRVDSALFACILIQVVA